MKRSLKFHSNKLLKELTFYRKLGEIYYSLTDVENLLKEIMNFITKQMNVDAGTLFLIDSQKRNLIFKVVTGRARKKLVGRTLPIGAGIAGYVTKTGKPYLTKDAINDKRWLREIGEDINYIAQEVLCVPLFGMEKLIGAIEVINKKSREGFTKDDLDFLKSNAGQIGILIEYSKFLNDTRERANQFRLLREIGTVINSTLKENEIMKRTIESITKLLHSESGSLLILDEKTNELYFDVAHGEKGEEVKRIRLKLGEGIAGWVAKEGKPLVVNDVQSDKRHYRKADEASRYVTRNILCVPVKIKGKVIGVIEAVNKIDGLFTKGDLSILTYLADQVAIAIDNAKLYEELKRTFLDTSEALAEAIEQRDPYTGGHTRRVLNYSVAVAKEMNLPEEEIENLKLAAILHDIGKIGVEDRILRKQGPLDQEEFENMKKHPEIGAEIIKHISSLKGVIPGILYHQERYDGKGYPTGAKNGEIPLAARIIAVCDTFDAMTTDRPYRKGLGVQAALDELKKFAGIQFDPDVVNGFYEAYKKGKVSLGEH
jgi:HD-GYP domain-containing protein (c-di-GMP phosphodiesterase class II)